MSKKNEATSGVAAPATAARRGVRIPGDLPEPTLPEAVPVVEAPVLTVSAPPVEERRYGVTPAELSHGLNRVRVEGRGEGKVEMLVPVGLDPYAAIKVLHDNGTSNVYENNPNLVVAIGADRIPITPWGRIENPDEMWISLYTGRGGLAARVYSTGEWNTYNGRGEFSQGRAADIDEGKREARASLLSYGADVDMLDGVSVISASAQE